MSALPLTSFSFLSLPLSLRLTIYDLALSASLVPLTTILLISREALEHVRRGVYDRVSVASMRGLARFVSSQGAVRYGKDARSLRCVGCDRCRAGLMRRGHSIRLGGGSTIAGISPILGRMISLTPNVESINLVCYTLRVDPGRHRLIAGLSAIKWVLARPCLGTSDAESPLAVPLHSPGPRLIRIINSQSPSSRSTSRPS